MLYQKQNNQFYFTYQASLFKKKNEENKQKNFSSEKISQLVKIDSEEKLL